MIVRLYKRFIEWLVLRHFPKCVACGCAGATMSWISDPVCTDCFAQLVEYEMAEHADIPCDFLYGVNYEVGK